jgi:hypothetical protein
MIQTQLPVLDKKREALAEKIRDRALGRYPYDFSPLSCYIEYKKEDPSTGVQFRDCVIDYTRCPNQRCIKKLT